MLTILTQLRKTIKREERDEFGPQREGGKTNERTQPTYTKLSSMAPAMPSLFLTQTTKTVVETNAQALTDTDYGAEEVKGLAMDRLFQSQNGWGASRSFRERR